MSDESDYPPVKCPHCGSYEIGEYDEEKSARLQIYVTCYDCNTDWVEFYNFEKAVILEEKT